MESLEVRNFTPFIAETDHLNKKEIINNMGEFLINKGYTEEDFKSSESFTFTFNIEKVVSYNKVFKATTRNGIFCAVYTQEYFEYKNKIAKLYENIDYLNNLTKFLSKPAIKLTMHFYINDKRKDLDNITKPFLDALFDKAKKINKKANDNCVFELVVRKKIVYDEEDKIVIKVKVLTIEEIEQDDLLFEANNFI